jgi:hypothetical protein
LVEYACGDFDYKFTLKPNGAVTVVAKSHITGKSVTGSGVLRVEGFADGMFECWTSVFVGGKSLAAGFRIPYSQTAITDGSVVEVIEVDYE